MGATLTTKYDDNLIGLSAQDRRAFLTSSAPFPTPLKTADDLESELELRPSVRRRLPQSLLATADYRLRVVQRLENSFTSYQSHSISVGLRPRVVGYTWSLRLRASLLPSFYLRAYRDRDYFNEFHAARYRNASYEGAVRYRIWQPLWLETSVGGGSYYYNRKFTEYDSEYREFSLGGVYDAPAGFGISAGYTRRLSENVGKNQPGAFFNSPISPGELGDSEYGDADYSEDDLSATVMRRLPMKKIPVTEASVSYRLRRRVYITDRPVELDPFHRGRLDHRHWFQYGLKTNMTDRFAISAFGVYEQRQTDTPVPQVSKVKDFIRREFGVTLSYQLL